MKVKEHRAFLGWCSVKVSENDMISVPVLDREEKIYLEDVSRKSCMTRATLEDTEVTCTRGCT